MALINCKECGKEISSTASDCPHCGCRTDHGRSVTEAKVYLVGLIICVVLMIVGVILMYNNIIELLDAFNRKSYWYKKEHDVFWYAFQDEQRDMLRWILVGGLLLVSGLSCGIDIGSRAKRISGNGYDAKKYTREDAAKVRDSLTQKYPMGGSIRKKSGTDVDGSTDTTKGWMCSCGYINISYRKSCGSCGRPKP